MFLKYFKNVIGEQNKLMYFRLHYLVFLGGLMPLKSERHGIFTKKRSL